MEKIENEQGTFWFDSEKRLRRFSNKTEEEWYDTDGNLHRDQELTETGQLVTLPAKISAYGVEYWFHGVLHNETGPAVIRKNYQLWYLNGYRLARRYHTQILRNPRKYKSIMTCQCGDSNFEDMIEQFGY